MSVSVASEQTPQRIRPAQLRFGQLAVVVKDCRGWSDYGGKVVQRAGPRLVVLGEEIGFSDIGSIREMYVEPLPNGTLLRVEDNE